MFGALVMIAACSPCSLRCVRSCRARRSNSGSVTPNSNLGHLASPGYKRTFSCQEAARSGTGLLMREWSPAGQAAAAGAVCAPAAGWRSVRSGGWGLDGDAVAEGFELGDEAAGLTAGVLAAGEVVGSEFGVGFPGGQDMPD